MESIFCPCQIYARKYSTLQQDKTLSKISRFSCANVKHIWNLLILSRQSSIYANVTTSVRRNDAGTLHRGLLENFKQLCNRMVVLIRRNTKTAFFDEKLYMFWRIWDTEILSDTKMFIWMDI